MHANFYFVKPSGIVEISAWTITPIVKGKVTMEISVKVI